ncbi:MAG: ferredoxin--NADP reductase [Betaproteobacteria bacterium]|nr:ferredoxin--NADP reductase [Betaproteobacteria bacterium]
MSARPALLIVHLDDEILGASPKDEHLIMTPAYYSLVVDRVIPETPEASTLVFRIPTEHQSEFLFHPGQFLTLRIPRGDRYSPRCYSISEGMPNEVAVTVKRVQDGFGSNWLLDHVRAGQRLEVRPPSGRFTLRASDAPVVFFAAGSGVTPMMSILRSAVAGKSSRPMAMFYANQSAQQVIFGDALRAISQNAEVRFSFVEWLDDARGFARPDDIRTFAEPWRSAHFMVCGPGPFMAMVIETLEDMGIDPERIQTERFQSLADEPLAVAHSETPQDAQIQARPLLVEGSRLEVSVSGAVHHLELGPSELLLEAMERMGIAVPYSCREGSCGSCMGKLLEGKVEMEVTDALSAKEIERGYILTCQARAASPQLKLDIDA